MTQKRWIKDHREHPGRRMIRVDFKQFIGGREMSTTVDEVARAIGYTVAGTIAMLDRGTIKHSTLAKLRKRFPDVEQYVKKGRS